MFPNRAKTARRGAGNTPLRRLPISAAAGPVGKDGPGPASLSLLNGTNKGKEILLRQALTTLGKPGVQVAAITRRPSAYYLTVVDAESVRDFYAAVVGWNVEPVDLEGYQDFTMIAPDTGVATEIGVLGDRFAGLAWGPYFPTEGQPPWTDTLFGVTGDGATNPDRREVVDIEKCDDCHKQLSLHGNNRTDEPAVCVTCHNPNATDDRQRGAGDCDAVLGPDDVTIDMKVMIHKIHKGRALITAVNTAAKGL